MPKPSWRKIEAALIELLRKEGFEIESERGESFINVCVGDFEEGTERELNICIGDFAKELEQRL